MTSHTVQDLYIILFFFVCFFRKTRFSMEKGTSTNSQKKLSHVGYFARYTK